MACFGMLQLLLLVDCSKRLEASSVDLKGDLAELEEANEKEETTKESIID
ncbi:hypothetical protein PVK06_040323 [Gossypium arboreum]|uniref:Uncharacterized protein n=1 Tax=Gossypium arboreum TaxID=29729 RepID=A0ABR0N5Y3_GOSAR|nr:hypothetical protein PVK06_040323 [Gossypium arboreum]